MPAVRDSERLRVGAALLAGALRVAIAGVLLAGASMVSPALAQGGLDAADRAYEEGEVASARDAYETALRSGSLDPAELVRAHLRLGILAALEGDTEGFERRSAFALALDRGRW